MPKITQKYFNRLHDKMLASSADYQAGYSFARAHRNYYDNKPVDELQIIRAVYLNCGNDYTAAIARVILEIIWECTTAGEAVA